MLSSISKPFASNLAMIVPNENHLDGHADSPFAIRSATNSGTTSVHQTSS
jgi:hypothetical protein